MLSSGFVSERVCRVRVGQADTKHKGTQTMAILCHKPVQAGAVLRPCCTLGSAVPHLLGTPQRRNPKVGTKFATDLLCPNIQLAKLQP